MCDYTRNTIKNLYHNLLFELDKPVAWWRHQIEKKNRVTGPLWGESTGHRWIPLTNTGDAELWCFLSFAPEQKIEQAIETLVIWDAIALIMPSL